MVTVGGSRGRPASLPRDGFNIPKGRALNAGYHRENHAGVGERKGRLFGPAGGERGSGKIPQGVGTCPESVRQAQ